MRTTVFVVSERREPRGEPAAQAVIQKAVTSWLIRELRARKEG